MEHGQISKNEIIAQLSKSTHGKLIDYVEPCQRAALQQADFLSHLIAWNAIKGQIRDSKVALPIAALTVALEGEYVENALAHLAKLGVRELLRAYRFALEVRPTGRMNRIAKLVRMYLRSKERDTSEWDRIALQNRAVLKELYALASVKPGREFMNIVLFGRTFDKTPTALPSRSVFSVVSRLKQMSAADAASEIITRRIPFLIAQGAMEERMKETDVLHALITRMSPTELVTNTPMLERLGVKDNPVLRGAFEESLTKAAKSDANVLKTSHQVGKVQDEGLKERLRSLQEKQLANRGIEGNWLVLADRSGSMHVAINVARHVAGTLGGMVKGKVWLVFFDNSPLAFDVTGMSIDQIEQATRSVMPGGSTSIGCGLQMMMDKKAEIDGIAIISDGMENATPLFAEVYKRYAKTTDREPTTYLYHCGNKGDGLTQSMKAAHLDLQVFDLPEAIDYYSVPNLAQTMRVGRYTLVEEIMDTPLLTVEGVLKYEGKEETNLAGTTA